MLVAFVMLDVSAWQACEKDVVEGEGALESTEDNADWIVWLTDAVESREVQVVTHDIFGNLVEVGGCNLAVQLLRSRSGILSKAPGATTVRFAVSLIVRYYETYQGN